MTISVYLLSGLLVLFFIAGKLLGEFLAKKSKLFKLASTLNKVLDEASKQALPIKSEEDAPRKEKKILLDEKTKSLFNKTLEELNVYKKKVAEFKKRNIEMKEEGDAMREKIDKNWDILKKKYGLEKETHLSLSPDLKEVVVNQSKSKILENMTEVFDKFGINKK